MRKLVTNRKTQSSSRQAGKERSMFVDSVKRIFIKWGPAILMSGIIFFASSKTSKDLPNFGFWDTLVKKSAHVIVYCLLGLSFLRGLKFTDKKTIFITLGMALLFAFSDEYHQSFVYGRHPSAVDVGIDMVGVSIALGIWLRSSRARKLLKAGLEK